MRVFHVNPSLDVSTGGPVAALVGLCTAQATLADMNVTIAASWKDPSELKLADELRSRGIDVDMIGPCHGKLRRHPELSRAIDRHVAEADVVHIHSLWEEIQHQSAVHAARQGKPYIINPCGMLDPWSLAQRKWKKRLYMAWRLRRNLRRASAIHFSTHTESQCLEPLRLTIPRIVEPHGVNLKEFVDLPEKGTFRNKFPQLLGRPYIVFLGRLHPGKGAEMLVPAMARLRHKQAMLVLVGPDQGGYKAHLDSLVRRHNLHDRVIFTGLQKGLDRVAALADADLFSLPSAHENFGIAVIEALAAGLPVIISDQVYIHAEITAAEVGGVVPMNVDALANELDRWLDDDALRRAAAERTRPYVWGHFDWRQIALRWHDHYARLIASATRERAADLS